MSYHDAPYEIQEIVSEYISRNLPPKSVSRIATVPIFRGGEFEFQEADGIHVAVTEMVEEPEFSGRYEADVVVAVATLRDVPIAEHKEFCRIVFDLMTAGDLREKLQELTTRIGFNQVYRSRRFITGAANSMRTLEHNQKMNIYFLPQ
jgi:hypothetical protein